MGIQATWDHLRGSSHTQESSPPCPDPHDKPRHNWRCWFTHKRPG